MDGYTKILKQQLSETELMIYLLVESGMNYRDLGERLGMSHNFVAKTYKAASDKLKSYADNGKLQTNLTEE